MHKLSVEAPPKILVERYLIEIAKNYNVPYEPDAMVRVSAADSPHLSHYTLRNKGTNLYFCLSPALYP